MSESQNTCTVKPWLLRGKRSGGGGCFSSSDSRMRYSPSFSCWLGIVRASTVSSRSFQNGPSSRTSANPTGKNFPISIPSPCVRPLLRAACLKLVGLARRGLPPDQRAGQPEHPGQPFAVDHLDQPLAGLAAQRLEIHVDRGQWRLRPG